MLRVNFAPTTRVFILVWRGAQSASIPLVPSRIGHPRIISQETEMKPVVREGVPPPLCAGRCASPPAGPVCAFDATGTARTFATLCELEAVSCRESTYYAITSLGEC
ncbi:uncharacterized protein LOC113229622 isoform X2 [Hyposmocoma kahamanoa]|uniref:uncharacterized protein LOC113229622 isoform X2 n=1 Tax=Hyposmocoma kahamanoa TaxID=1477025 RepID=UPI000E6D7984|nr:uncharacterized protein LOC113229622 isoform X2 [Hyposmocoma kahamanoa]